ncbi:MAG: hypothetical protein BM565_11010 [Gammaproteobacteria bacterium MedPE]|nr:MAG: hypothetical protein BM565_11010 [Gammaproteobacteria bacterium MedPE]
MNFKKKLLLAGFLTATASSAAFAAFYPSHYIERYYYSDAAKKKEVGSLTQFCSGSTYYTGKVTPYFHELTIPCRRGGGDL